MDKLKSVSKKYLNRETVSYLFFGVLTTAVNFLVFHLCDKVLAQDVLFKDKNYLLSNVVAWTAAVLFAFFTNKLFVFKSRGVGIKKLAFEFSAFIGARLFSLGVDEASMFLLVSVLAVDKLLSKLTVQVLIVIINYFFSKFFIFSNKRK